MDRRWLTYCHLSAVSVLPYGPNSAALQLTFTQLWQEGRRLHALGNKSNSAESKTVLIVFRFRFCVTCGTVVFSEGKAGWAMTFWWNMKWAVRACKPHSPIIPWCQAVVHSNVRAPMCACSALSFNNFLVDWLPFPGSSCECSSTHACFSCVWVFLFICTKADRVMVPSKLFLFRYLTFSAKLADDAELTH